MKFIVRLGPRLSHQISKYLRIQAAYIIASLGKVLILFAGVS